MSEETKKPNKDWEIVSALMEKHGSKNPVDWPAKDNAAYWDALERMEKARKASA